jgi:hypothetical protein
MEQIPCCRQNPFQAPQDDFTRAYVTLLHLPKRLRARQAVRGAVPNGSLGPRQGRVGEPHWNRRTGAQGRVRLVPRRRAPCHAPSATRPVANAHRPRPLDLGDGQPGAGATRADIRSGGNMAYYSAGTDHVQMPPFECFRDAESYYAALAHEMTHNAGPSVMPRRFEFRAQDKVISARRFGIIRAIQGMRAEHRRACTSLVVRW